MTNFPAGEIYFIHAQPESNSENAAAINEAYTEIEDAIRLAGYVALTLADVAGGHESGIATPVLARIANAAAVIVEGTRPIDKLSLGHVFMARNENKPILVLHQLEHTNDLVAGLRTGIRELDIRQYAAGQAGQLTLTYLGSEVT